LKKQQKLQVDPLLFYENMLQCLKLCFQLSVKYLAVKKLSSWVSLQKFLKDAILLNTCCMMKTLLKSGN